MLYIFNGIAITLQYTLISFITGCILGTIIALLSFHKVGSLYINCFISVIRGTPLLVQLTLIYFVLPGLIFIPISIFCAGCIAFSINSSAYIAEIIRAGLNGIDKGQFEVCKALHLPPLLMWKDIILPQVLKIIFPALVNEAITLLKETALISVLGEQDIMRRAQLVSAEHYTYLFPLLTAAASYYLLTFIMERGAKHCERYLSYDNSAKSH
jgi:polar amino acid transport system permease protein